MYRTGNTRSLSEQAIQQLIIRTVYRFIGVWQQESGRGPQIANGAVDCVPDLCRRGHDLFTAALHFEHTDE